MTTTCGDKPSRSSPLTGRQVPTRATGAVEDDVDEIIEGQRLDRELQLRRDRTEQAGDDASERRLAIRRLLRRNRLRRMAADRILDQVLDDAREDGLIPPDQPADDGNRSGEGGGPPGGGAGPPSGGDPPGGGPPPWAVDPYDLGGDQVLEPHPRGHQNAPEFIPADADFIRDRPGDPVFDLGPDDLGESINVDPVVAERLRELVPQRRGKGGTRRCAAELHLLGAEPASFLHAAGERKNDPPPMYGLTSPERHILSDEEWRFPDQPPNEVIPTSDPRRRNISRRIACQRVRNIHTNALTMPRRKS